MGWIDWKDDNIIAPDTRLGHPCTGGVQIPPATPAAGRVGGMRRDEAAACWRRAGITFEIRSQATFYVPQPEGVLLETAASPGFRPGEPDILGRLEKLLPPLGRPAPSVERPR